MKTNLTKISLTFCPICNKGRQTPLWNSTLHPTHIKDVVRCNCCKRLFVGEKEVTVEIKEKPPEGEDLRKYIRDWYRCPACSEIVAGWATWMAHVWQKHHLSSKEFEEKFGKPEESYYGIDFGSYFNPSKRDEN